MLAEAYQKYLYVPRPVSKRYPMDVQHRAKQFAPFAALRGFEEIVQMCIRDSNKPLLLHFHKKYNTAL